MKNIIEKPVIKPSLIGSMSCLVLASMVFFSPTVLADKKMTDLDKALYKDPKQNINTRIDDLLSRMSLEEKVAQMLTIWQKRQEIESEEGAFVADKAEELMGMGIGQIARPSENKAAITPNKTPLQTVSFVNDSQRWLMENTRLAIPAIYHEEALHGHAARDSTSFPQAIALASSWDPALLKAVYTVAAQEVRKRGGTQALTPILDVARDPRWGRIEETMGEDPYLVAALNVEGIKGFQGDVIGEIPSDRVIATLKHLAGHGEPTGGLNTAPAPIGERTLREVFLFPFEAAIKLAGARSVMASYNEIDGVPSHASKLLLQDILRDEWKFDGVVVSDYFAISELISRHHLAETKAEAAVIALTAGVDVETPDGDAFPHLVKLVEDGDVDVALIDRAVKRILKEKFLLGLFENPYVDTANVDTFIGNDEHRKIALAAAEKSVVLLKNDKKLLPLNANNLKKVAIIGPHADEVLLGGYSDVPRQTVSVVEGFTRYLDGKAEVTFARGTRITIENGEAAHDSVAANTRSKERWNDDDVILAGAKDVKGLEKEAVKLAKKSDVAIVVVGDNEATSREAWAESHLGDRTSLGLMGEQQQLVEAILATGTPTIVILLNGRPLAISELAKTAPTIIEGWYLGQETGDALAKIVFGDVNPGGKLPLSIPRSVGHIPAYYNHKPSAKRGYAFDESDALFPFGFGLSYTEFEYSDLQVKNYTAQAGGRFEFSVVIQNTGKRAGDEVVQLYINDPIASLTRPVKELKGFKRVHLVPGEKKRITFSLQVNQLGFYDQAMRYVVEPGDIDLMLASSSQDVRLKQRVRIVNGDKSKEAVEVDKAFLSEVSVENL
ncbi:MAG: beta-glucosidase [Flavobacteriales bacterium]|jgi:beta-glucosidase